MRRIVAKRLYLMASQSSDFMPTRWHKTNRGTIICTGFRRTYQDLKKQYKVA